MSSVMLAAIYMLAAVGLMILQAFLSKRDSKYLGLIIPIVFFLISLVYPLNMPAPATGIDKEFVVSLVISLVMANIPTFITLGIYFISRKEMKNEQ